MSKEAIIIQSFNDVKQQYEYSVKGYDVTESVKILLKRHKEEYDKEKNVFAGIQGFIEAQQLYENDLVDLKAKLAESEKSKESYRLQNEHHHLQLLQFYSRLGVEAFGADIHEKALETLMIMKEQLAEKDLKIIELETKLNLKDNGTNV